VLIWDACQHALWMRSPLHACVRLLPPLPAALASCTASGLYAYKCVMGRERALYLCFHRCRRALATAEHPGGLAPCLRCTLLCANASEALLVARTAADGNALCVLVQVGHLKVVVGRPRRHADAELMHEFEAEQRREGGVR
jgi:hypothetical protein